MPPATGCTWAGCALAAAGAITGKGGGVDFFGASPLGPPGDAGGLKNGGGAIDAEKTGGGAAGGTCAPPGGGIGTRGFSLTLPASGEAAAGGPGVGVVTGVPGRRAGGAPAESVESFKGVIFSVGIAAGGGVVATAGTEPAGGIGSSGPRRDASRIGAGLGGTTPVDSETAGGMTTGAGSGLGSAWVGEAGVVSAGLVINRGFSRILCAPSAGVGAAEPDAGPLGACPSGCLAGVVSAPGGGRRGLSRSAGGGVCSSLMHCESYESFSLHETKKFPSRSPISRFSFLYQSS
jgi:hypothetical protein